MTRTERAALAGKTLYDHMIVVIRNPHSPPLFVADAKWWIELGRALYGDESHKVRELLKLAE